MCWEKFLPVGLQIKRALRREEREFFTASEEMIRQVAERCIKRIPETGKTKDNDFPKLIQPK